MKSLMKQSTGLEDLDNVLSSLLLGDNVVWQVDNIEDYKAFVLPFVERSLNEGRRVLYMRFSTHPPLINPADKRVHVHKLDAFSGFESFARDVYTIISAEGREAFYVFDCLSDLLTAWATDLMIGNFFLITCPYLYELDTIAYFSILRNSHDYKTVARIRETTQILIDVYRIKGEYYVHPLKVYNRYSPAMFFPHKRTGDRFIPIVNSADASDYINFIQLHTADISRRNLDFWDRLFLEVGDLVARQGGEEEQELMVARLCRLIIGQDERILSLVRKYFDIDDFLAINNRLIGTGYIGGKSVGMLIARKILNHDNGRAGWDAMLEPHDSFYIGSDVFHSFIIQNGLWKLFMAHKTREGYFECAPELQERMSTGVFPEEIKEQFRQIIEHFGQFPFIVRSSSLLEDAYGHAFAGKYESLFCVNQGGPVERYENFTAAVRAVYASTMNWDALAYRLQRGLDTRDEEMALLVQRVSGTQHRQYFFPDIGGVGLSYNTFVWKDGMDPDAGMVRIVFGLGTRAVDRVEGDYPRIVSLDSPLLRPHAGIDELRRFSQHEVDLLNIEQNRIESVDLGALLEKLPELDMNKYADIDIESSRQIREMGLKGVTPWVISFDGLLSKTDFPVVIRDMMTILQKAYDYPVDIEFTVNFDSQGSYRINLLQCRPYQAKGLGARVEIPEDIPRENIFFQTRGNFLGGSLIQPLKLVVYVDPAGYARLPQTGKYDIARLIGQVNRHIGEQGGLPTMLMGPGRWGTTTPSLGVPVRFAEINHINVLVEIAEMSENIMPELSFGTHFFHDLVETEIFYIALFPEKEEVLFDVAYLGRHENIINSIVPDSGAYADIVGVYDFSTQNMHIMADIISQRLLCVVNFTIS